MNFQGTVQVLVCPGQIQCGKKRKNVHAEHCFFLLLFFFFFFFFFDLAVPPRSISFKRFQFLMPFLLSKENGGCHSR